MRYTVLQPAAALRPMVECYWRLDGIGAGRPDETIVPDGCMEIVLHLEDRFARVGPAGDAAPQPRAFVAGQMLGPLVVRPQASVETWGIRFRPAGAAAFFGGDIPDLTGHLVALESLWGHDAGRFVERLAGARTTAARRDALDALLLARRSFTVDALVAAAAGAIVATRGAARTGVLAARAGIGRRQLERRFLRGVGVPPGTLARIVRFQHVFRLAGGADGEPRVWAGLACDAGYYDQAHLLRDFRQFAGSTPPRFLAVQGEFSRALTARRDDAFVQDPARGTA